MLFLFLFFTSMFTSTLSEKFCINCRFYIKPKYGMLTSGKCSAFYERYNKELNMDDDLHYLITKKQKKDSKLLLDCYVARKYEYLCGINANSYMESDYKLNHNR